MGLQGADIALLPQGKRRNALADAAQMLLETDMADRCLVFGAAAAKHYGIIYANRRRMGRPISTQDAQIPAMTGIGSPYEPPPQPDLRLETGLDSLENCVGKVMALVA